MHYLYYISFSVLLTSGKMKLCSVVALFLIWVIPMKITHVYSQSELLWGAKGSGRPPKISRLIPKMHRADPSITGTSDDSRGSTKLGYDIDLNTRMLIQLILYICLWIK